MPRKKSSTSKPVIKIKRKHNKNSASKIKLLLRQTAAMKLRLMGASYRKIASRLKDLKLADNSYSEGLAYRDIDEGVKRLQDEQKELAENNLRLDLDRLDELMLAIWDRAVPPVDPDTGTALPADLVAQTGILQILDRRERLLNYKSLHAEKPQLNFTIDWSQFSTEEILKIRERLSHGEDALAVITEIQAARKPDVPKPD